MKNKLLYAATIVLALGCNGANPVSPREPTVGKVSGTVTLLGSAGSPAPAGQIALYTSLENFEQRKPAYAREMLATGPNERTYTFAFEHVQPGKYYLTACFSFGCGEYRNAETGALMHVTARAAQATTLAIAF